MESELVSDSLSYNGSDKLVPIFQYTKVFEEHFPMYLSIGMTYDQYWNDDPKLTKYYLEAYKIKQKRSNYEAWLQGLYIYEALCDVSPVLHAFAKKGTKPTKYPNEPYPIDETEHKEREQKKTNIRMEALRQRLIAMSNKKR